MTRHEAYLADLEGVLEHEVCAAVLGVHDLFEGDFSHLSYPEQLLCMILVDASYYIHDGRTPQDYTPHNYPHDAIFGCVAHLCKTLLANTRWQEDRFK